MRLLRHGSARPSRPIFLTMLSVAPFTGLLALGAASTQDTPASRQQTQARAETVENVDLLDQSHAAFRRSVLQEFERVAPVRNVRIDSKSLIITSCDDGAMIAGLSASPRMDLGPERSDVVKQEKTPTSERTDPTIQTREVNPHEVLGMVAISGNFLGVRSGPIDASTGRPIPGATTPGSPVDTTLNQGFYLVRRDPSGNAVQLVNKDERIVVTIPYRHERMGGTIDPMDKDPLDKPGRDLEKPGKDTGNDKPGKENSDKPGKDNGNKEPGNPNQGQGHDNQGQGRDNRESADPVQGRAQEGTASHMGDIAEWPKIYMAILHAVEPRFSR